MFNNTKKGLFGVMIGGLIAGMAYQGPVHAAAADRGKDGVEGSVSCGGAYYIRNGGTEIQRSTYVVRNYSDTGMNNI